MRRTVIMRSEELKFTCFKVLFLVIMLSELKHSWLWFTTIALPEFGMFVIPTKRWIFLSCLQVSVLKPAGMVRWFSSDVWPRAKLTSQTHFPIQLWSTGLRQHQFQQPGTHQYFAAQQFALIWAASLCHTWVHTRVGFVCATDLSTTSSVEWDKALPLVTCPTSTTRCTVQSFASRNRCSPTNQAFSYMSERNYKLRNTDARLKD